MGAPSDDQIDEAIAWGLANRWSEARIVRHLATLERMSDEELAKFGVYPPSDGNKSLPSMPRSEGPGRSSSGAPRGGPSGQRDFRRNPARTPRESHEVEEVEDPPFPLDRGTLP